MSNTDLGIILIAIAGVVNSIAIFLNTLMIRRINRR